MAILDSGAENKKRLPKQVARRPKILFVCHSASRTGAPILLLHLLQWLKRHSNFQLDVIIHGRGELLDEFCAIAPTKIWRSFSLLRGLMPLCGQLQSSSGLETMSLRAILGLRHYDLIYLNTVANWQQVGFLASRAQSVLWHIHELEYAIRLTMGEDGWRSAFPLADRFVAVSAAVRDTLCGRFGVPEQKVDLVHGFASCSRPSPDEHKWRRHRVRVELGLTDAAFVVGGCGSLGWRKGTDLFLQIARVVQQETQLDIHFLWVGGGLRPTDKLEFDHDIQKMGLTAICHLVENTAEVVDYYCAMDAFALTSREDPFPLVMLEAGAIGLPIVCFADAGGGPEFVGADAGLVVPYLDTRAFAMEVLTLRANADLRHHLGSEAARRVRGNYTLERQAPKLMQCIERCLTVDSQGESSLIRGRDV